MPDHQLSQALRDRLASSRSELFEVCEIDFPDETLRYCDVPFTSLERGHFDGKVTAYGAIDIAPAEFKGPLGAIETTVDISDVDRSIARIQEGSHAREIVGCALRRYLADPTIAFADWKVLFDGIITKDPERGDDFLTRFTARVDDAALITKAPFKNWTVDRMSWPLAHPDALTKPAPIVYGEHSAADYQTDPGFLPGLHIDTVNHRYAFGAGRMKSIDRIYVNALQTPSGGGSVWSVSYRADFRGRIWTVVTFAADQGSAVITADGKGYEATGNGSGTLITDPADQLAHFLTNFCFNDWRNGSAWYATSSRIGASLTGGSDVVKAFLGIRQPTGAKYYGERTTGYEVIRDFCDNFGVRAYWSHEGKLEFCVENVAVQPYTGVDVDWEQDLLPGGFKIEPEDIRAVESLRVEHVHEATGGRYHSSFGVTPPDSAGDEEDSLSLSWSPSA